MDKTVLVRLRAEVAQYLASMKQGVAATRDLGREMTGLGKTSKADLDNIGRGALVMAGGLALAFGGAAKAAVDWESAWAGVTKTVDGSAAEMEQLEVGLRDLAKELPATHGEIAAVAEAAGALGIQRTAIESFTRTMIDLGETTNVTSDQAATAFARIANIMGTTQTDFDRMGSTLVALGNNGASTESEILELANRLAAAGNIAGLTEADIFAMASSLASVGVEAEAGGTALSKVFTTVSDAVLDGSDKLDTFARVAGVSADRFAASFREDPATAINDFVIGLGRMIDSGQSLTPVFEELELTDSRLMNALKSTAGAGDLLTQSLEMGRRAWEENNALQSEAEKRYDTTAAKLEVARNNVVDLAIDVGDKLLPVLAGAADGATSVTRGFQEMPGALQIATMGIGGVTLASAGAIAVTTQLIPKLVAARAALIKMGAAGRIAAGAMPWLAAIAVGIAAVSYAMGENAKEAEEAEDRVKGWTDAIREATSPQAGAERRLVELASQFEEVAHDIDASGLSVSEWAAGLSGTDAEFNAFISQLRRIGPEAFGGRDALETLVWTLENRTRPEFELGAENAETLGRVLGDTGDAASNAAPKVGSLASELGLSADEAERAREEFEELLDAYKGAVDPLFAMLDALQANREALGAEAAARAEGAKAVSDATEDVADAEKNLRDARGVKDNVEGIAAAEERLADARERLGEVEADAAITAEEKAQFDRDAAQSALDLEVRARELAGAVSDGTVSLESAQAMLKEWADQGSLTAEQAEGVTGAFQGALYAADAYAGDYVATAYANTKPAIDALAELREKIRETFRTGEGKGAPISINQVEHLLNPGRSAMGGDRSGWQILGDGGGPELVHLPVGSRVFPYDQTRQMVGSMFTGGGSSFAGLTGPTGDGGGTTAYDQSRTTTLHAPITVADRGIAGQVQFHLKRTVLELDN